MSNGKGKGECVDTPHPILDFAGSCHHDSVSRRDKGAISYKLFTQEGRRLARLCPTRCQAVCGQPACESPPVARCVGEGPSDAVTLAFNPYWSPFARRGGLPAVI
ncbi:hypothetical protein E2C01_044206 [Portunus trituberculatus]|uniref:Uncharacterized protein n=1 Tax=Portunus trituberculatus TaxID=210409 RepID=A0A5B7FZS5_PORTR|nr:hypothetical protein [Portunus trituberculatus]